MTVFLCSSYCIREENRLDPANHFIEELKTACGRDPLRAVFVCSDPEEHELTDAYAYSTKGCLEAEGFSFTDYAVLDSRREEEAPDLIGKADLVILSGGHVPTQHRFMEKIRLRNLLKGFPGVVLGSSAGSMNCAEEVYSQPELDGEALDPAYERFFPGLGLTPVQILPHYQEVKDVVLDGLRIFEEIAFPDSLGRCFVVLVDGSYVRVSPEETRVFGLSWLIRDGKQEPFCEEGESRRLPPGTR